MTLIGGHQRLKALNSLGWKTAPCVVLDLSKDKERLLNIAMNKIGGEFDKGRLKDLLLDLDDSGADLSLAGLEDVELEKLLLPPEPAEIKTWNLEETYEPFWITIRGPLESLPDIKKALSAADLGACRVEASA